MEISNQNGWILGIFMTLFNVLFEFKEKPFSTQISNPNLYLRAFFYLVTGIFVLGYFNWNQKEKILTINNYLTMTPSTNKIGTSST
jgi:hypothetical protein